MGGITISATEAETPHNGEFTGKTAYPVLMRQPKNGGFEMRLLDWFTGGQMDDREVAAMSVTEVMDGARAIAEAGADMITEAEAAQIIAEAQTEV